MPIQGARVLCIRKSCIILLHGCGGVRFVPAPSGNFRYIDCFENIISDIIVNYIKCTPMTASADLIQFPFHNKTHIQCTSLILSVIP